MRETKSTNVAARSKRRRTPVETRKSEIRYMTRYPYEMLNRYLAKNVYKKWTEDVADEDTGEVISIERETLLFERGTFIDAEVRESIVFHQMAGDIDEICVSNQKRLGIEVTNDRLSLYRASLRVKGKRKVVLLYATSVRNADTILRDYVELSFQGGFRILDIKEMDYHTTITDTDDGEDDGSADAVEKRFYQINARVILHDPEGKERDDQTECTFIVHTSSAYRANLLIELHLLDLQEKRRQAAEENPRYKFLNRTISSQIEESKIMPVGCFIPRVFSEAYLEDDEEEGEDDEDRENDSGGVPRPSGEETGEQIRGENDRIQRIKEGA